MMRESTDEKRAKMRKVSMALTPVPELPAKLLQFLVWSVDSPRQAPKACHVHGSLTKAAGTKACAMDSMPDKAAQSVEAKTIKVQSDPKGKNRRVIFE